MKLEFRAVIQIPIIMSCNGWCYSDIRYTAFFIPTSTNNKRTQYNRFVIILFLYLLGWDFAWELSRLNMFVITCLENTRSSQIRMSLSCLFLYIKFILEKKSTFVPFHMCKKLHDEWMEVCTILFIAKQFFHEINHYHAEKKKSLKLMINTLYTKPDMGNPYKKNRHFVQHEILNSHFYHRMIVIWDTFKV